MRVRTIHPTIQAVPGRVVVEDDKGNELFAVTTVDGLYRMTGELVEQVTGDPFASRILLAVTEAWAVRESREWAADNLRELADEMTAKADEFRATANQLLKCGVPA